MGASPEILVKTYCEQGQSYFSTIALAGTQKLEQAEAIKNAAWKIKEIEEQAMVSRYIINCFKKIRLREFDEDGPKTVSAGNLLHLRTDFTVNMDQVNFPELGSVMLRLLHPTSAVCGQPKDSSVAFLKKHEGYDRGLYAGFLGPVNIREEVNIFVNLRCMQLFRKQALLYAGAGVTADSDPVKEWQETAMKMQTLQQLL
jgi:isochorismate synthase